MSRRAIILAGGEGRRLRPYTMVFPKPLLPLGEKPILEIIIQQLCEFGFDHITLAVNHQAEMIKTFFGDGSRWGLKIDYSLEQEKLSTIAPLKLIKDLPDNFLIMNGDILTDLNFGAFYDSHIAREDIFTVSGYLREHKSEFGELTIGDNGYLTGFQEKPITPLYVSMGIYMASKKILKMIPPSGPYGFDHLMLDLIAIKQPSKINIFDGYWLDIGRPDDYMKAMNDYNEGFAVGKFSFAKKQSFKSTNILELS